MCLLVSDQGFTPTLFSAKELKNHVSTHIQLCVYKMSVQVGEMGRPHAGNSLPTRCYGSDGRCWSPKQAAWRLKAERSRGATPARSSPALQRQLPAQTHGTDLGLGGEQEGRAPGGGVQEHQNPRGQEGCPRACRPREDWDEVTRQDLGVPCPAFRGHTLSHGSHGTPAASGRSPGEAGCLRCELRHRSTASVSQR